MSARRPRGRARGERHGRARLRSHQIEWIWILRGEGLSYRQIAVRISEGREPPISLYTVRSVLEGESWVHHPASRARLIGVKPREEQQDDE